MPSDASPRQAGGDTKGRNIRNPPEHATPLNEAIPRVVPRGLFADEGAFTHEFLQGDRWTPE
jgi:hypothetical protein